jgi:hypothetical protein
MRQGSNPKRSRNKGGNRGASGSRNPLNRSFESNGPGGKVRGNPHQVYEKYLAMARDYQADDPIMAENLLQHADHYFRVILDANGGKGRRDDNRKGDGEDKGETAQNADGDNADGRGSGNDGGGGETPESAASDYDSAGAEDKDAPADDGSGGDSGDEPAQTQGAKRSRRGRKPKASGDSDTNESSESETASDAA